MQPKFHYAARSTMVESNLDAASQAADILLCQQAVAPSDSLILGAGVTGHSIPRPQTIPGVKLA